MKKKIAIITLLFVCTFMVLFFSFEQKNKKINKILNSESYSYLNKEAKNYIEKVYEETGNVILTEKNKKENEPYLSSKFVEYLALSEEEKKEVEEIPEPYVIDYVERTEGTPTEMPSSYDLRDYGFITPIKDQGNTDLCWDFTTIEQAESFLMKKSNTSYNSSTKTFSIRQLDYATSTNGISNYTNDFGTRKLTEAGNFNVAAIALVNGVGLVNNSLMPFDESKDYKELYEVLNYGNSQYEMDSSILFPIFDFSSTDTNFDTYISQLKEIVMNNGGAYVGTQAPGFSCSSLNSDNKVIVRVDDSCTLNAGHAMQIIGWNDNYEYSYCKDTTNNKHESATGCSSANLVTGRGAWILRNSWGESEEYAPYLYLAYDTESSTISAITTLSSMENRNWDNNYSGNFNPVSASYDTTYTEQFTKKIDTPEKVQKVKFFTFSQNGSYYVSITSNNETYNNVKQITVDYPGYATIDLSDLNIIITDSKFNVNIRSTNGGNIFYKSISAFTKNQSSSALIKSNIDNLQLDALTTDYSFRLYSNTKNINSNQTINYNLYNKNNVDVSNFLTITKNTVAKNDVNTNIKISKNIPQGLYTLVLSKSSASENIPIQIGEIEDEVITYYSNDGLNNKYTQAVSHGENATLLNNTFTYKGYTFKNWNTRSDGNGTTYTNNQVIQNVTENIDLYAQWTPNTYKVVFNSNSGSGSMDDETFIYDESRALFDNQFTKTGYKFSSWNTMADGSGTQSYTNKQIVKNLTFFNNATYNLYAQWTPIKYNIAFNSNGGSGTMSNQEHTYDSEKALSSNTFTKTGYVFVSWNTLENGTGTPYTNEQVIRNITSTSNDTITLYAQWRPINYSIIFNSNGGTGTMANEEFTYNVEKALSENTFTKVGYTFVSWNTTKNGTGTPYTNKQLIKNLLSNNNEEITFYAQWSPIKYNVIFNSNGGTGSMNSQEFTYDVEQALSSNMFVNEGNSFIGWNTKRDGTGTSYTNGKQVKNLVSTNNGEITLYAQWTPIKYDVVYNSNTGTGTMNNQQFTYGVENSLSTNNFTKIGYKFISWNTNSDGTGTPYTNGQQVMNLTSTNNGQVTLYAIWAPINYKVSFNSNGGTGTMELEDFTYNSEKELTNNTLTRTGYTFTSWNTLEDGTGTTYTNKQKVKNLTYKDNEQVTLYAQWTPISYSVAFNSNTGTGTMTNQQFTYGVEKELSANAFTKTGYYFSSWNTKQDGSGTPYTDKQKVSNLSSKNNDQLTLYAQWSPIKYSIKFNSNTGTGTMDNQEFTYNVEKALSENTFTKVGYTFVSWNTTKNGTGTPYTNKQLIKNLLSNNNEEITFYAQWSPIKYNVVFNANGGTGDMNNQEFTYDVEKELSQNLFTKENHKFVSWNTKQDGSGNSYTNKQTVKNLSNERNGQVILYAQWIEKEEEIEISHYEVDYENKYIDSIEINTTEETMSTNMNLGEEYRVEIDVNASGKVYTGGKTKIYKNDALFDTFTNIIRGDTNGDGIINYLDFVNVYNHIQKTKHPESNKKLLKNEYLIAGDMSGDSIINYLDYVRIYNKIKELKGGTN